jgi:hypothetical protein
MDEDQTYAAKVVVKQCGLPFEDACKHIASWTAEKVAALVEHGRNGLITACHSLLSEAGLPIVEPVVIDEIAATVEKVADEEIVAAGAAVDEAVPAAAPVVAVAETVAEAAVETAVKKVTKKAKAATAPVAVPVAAPVAAPVVEAAPAPASEPAATPAVETTPEAPPA